MVSPFLPETVTDTLIPDLRARGLETKLAIDGRQVAFQNPDGTVVEAIDVTVVWAGRQPQTQGTTTTRVIGVDGDLQARPADVTEIEAGALFQIDGNPCEASQAPIVDRGVAVIPFTLTATRTS